MKSIYKYMVLGLVGSFLAASCDVNDFNFLNQEPEFDDANAFVAFDKAAFSIDENSEETLRLPVTLASVAGLEETVSFKIEEPEEKGAKAGVNYELLTTSGVLSFDKFHRTQYIEFKVMPDGMYTGDLKFKVVLNEGATVGTGAAGTCTVTVCDIDHPLAALLGAYTVTGEDNWDGVTSWPLVLTKDLEDPTLVWFSDLANLGGNASAIGPFYGNVDSDLTSIVIPFGQVSALKYQEKDIVLRGLSPEGNAYEEGSVIVTINKDASGSVVGLDFGQEYGFWVYGKAGANFGVVWPGITAVKD